ncbi:hypothetical protein TrST_g3950 [Triparma strigata]|uniref:PX domain-containing protein n=1 Tax=Triparma strigata TaxID=1606541 RepID=A0A9W6ZX42_9STRA|nr:hypothetical protein TrST_g3950 [Triparma strigata]
MTVPVLDCTFPNGVNEAISLILGQLCIDSYKRANVGRLVAVHLVKMLEKNIYWYKIFKAEALKSENLQNSPPAPQFETPPSTPGYTPPPSYISAQKFQHSISLSFLKHKRLHASISHENLNNHTETVTPKEQQYLRTISHHLIRHLIKNNQHQPLQKTCPIVTALVSDVLANCVLNPVVNLFCPSTVNGWIKMAVDTKPIAVVKPKLNSEDDINTRLYSSSSLVTPGLPPPFITGGLPDPGFRYFSGKLGPTESSLLLRDKNNGSFIIRLTNATDLHISYVPLDYHSKSSVDNEKSTVKKKGKFMKRDKIINPTTSHSYDIIKSEAADKTSHISVNYTFGKFYYGSRDEYYFERLFALSEGFETMQGLLECLEGDLILMGEGIVFEREVYENVEEEERQRSRANSTASNKSNSNTEQNTNPNQRPKEVPSTPDRKDPSTPYYPKPQTPNPLHPSSATRPPRPPRSHVRTSTQPIHLQQQRPLFSPPSHKRRRSSGSRIKKLWLKELLEDSDVSKLIKNTPGKKKNIKHKEVMTFANTPEREGESEELSPITSVHKKLTMSHKTPPRPRRRSENDGYNDNETDEEEQIMTSSPLEIHTSHTYVKNPFPSNSDVPTPVPPPPNNANTTTSIVSHLSGLLSILDHHSSLISHLKLCVDSVIIFLMNNSNTLASRTSLGFTTTTSVWETKGFVESARLLVNSIETLLRHGMKDTSIRGFTDNVIKMTSEGQRKDKFSKGYMEELGFSDSDSDSDEEDEEEGGDDIDSSEAGKAVREIMERSNKERLEEKKKFGRRGTLRENAEYYREEGEEEEGRSPKIEVVKDYFNDEVGEKTVETVNEEEQVEGSERPKSLPSPFPSPQPSTSLLLSSSRANPSDIAGKALVAAWLQTGSTYQVMKLIVRATEESKVALYHSGAAMLDPETMANAVHILKRLNEVEIKVDTTAVVTDDGNDEVDEVQNDPSMQPQHPTYHGQARTSSSIRLNFQPPESPRRNLSAPEPLPLPPHPLKRISSDSSAGSMKNPANMIGNAFGKMVWEVKDTAKGIRNPFKRKSQARKSTTESLLSQLPSITSSIASGSTNSHDHNVDSGPPSPTSNNNDSPDEPQRNHHQHSLDQTYHHNSVTTTRLRLARQKGLEAWSRKIASSNNNGKWTPRSSIAPLHQTATTLQNHITRMSSSPYSLQTVGPARAFEIPSEDSSLLFSARPRPIRPIGVHNDVNTGNNFISFVASYREVVPPSPLGEMSKAKGGVRVWRCVVHYYPSDRSARVEDPKWEDNNFEGDEWNKSKLPMRFREKNARASCRRTWGGEIGGEVSIDEFEYSPKQGQRENFQYRMSMWRKPTVNILGVTFEILDGYMVDLVGYDGSLREVSDACLSYYLLSNESDEGGKDNLTVSIVDGEKPVTQMSSSKIRSALCVLSSKQEVEAQALLSSSRAKKTVSVSPTIAMLTYATSKGGGEQLVRDLGRPGLNGCRVSLDELKAMGVYKESGMLNLECTVEGVVKQTSGGEMFAKPVILYRLRVGCERREGEDGRVVREEWIIMRRYNDFVSLHKKLKGQLTEHNPKGKLLTALEGSGTGQRMRLLPALPPKKSLNAMGVGGGTKFLEQRGRKLGNYLKYLLNRRHVLWSSAELVDFLCASDSIGRDAEGVEDDWGRTEGSRSVVMMGGVGFGGSKTEEMEREMGGDILTNSSRIVADSLNQSSATVGLVGTAVSKSSRHVTGMLKKKNKDAPQNAKEVEAEGKSKSNTDARAMAFQAAMAASIKERLKEVSLREVQEGIFDLVKELLSLDKATFLRGRMISVIRGLVNFMTSGSSFHKTLLKLHNQYLTGETISTGVKWVRELLWPKGEFKEAAPPYTLQEKVELEAAVANGLPALIPDTLTSVVGDELAEEGAKTLHEMIQNPLVLRSMAYQLLDLLLLEAYPDLNIDLDALHSVED